MGELHYFKKYLEEELQLTYRRSNPVESRDNALDMHRITEIETTMRILGEYEYHVVNCNR